MKNLSKENVDKLPSKSIDLKSKLNLAQGDKNNVRKSEGFTTFNLSSKTSHHDGLKGLKKVVKPTNEIVLNNSTIKYISNSDPIEVVPSEIIFKDILTNQTYEITVYIRNLTKTSRRIRVYQPQTAKFRADYDMQGAIAAGIAMKLVITFETSVMNKNGFHDTLKIVSDENYERDIPLHAYPQQASIIFEPFLNLGFVKMNSEKTEKIFFLNEGKIPAKVALKTAENQDLVIDPASFTMEPGQEFSVKVTYQPKDAGIFRGLIDVETDAQSLIKQIDVNATSVEFAKFIIDEHGSKIDQQDFGTFYYGEVKKLNCYLVNNTPKKYKFTSRFRDGLIYGSGDMASLQTPIEVGKEQTVKVMSCEPSEGVIDCYSQIQLTFRCQASVNYKHQIAVHNNAISKEEIPLDNHSDYSYSAIFEFNGEKEDSVIIHITGHGVCPNVKISPQNILEFGDCSVNDHKDIMFQIANRNMQIPIDVFVPRIPYFHVTPSKCNIGAGETGHFVATFEPKQMQSQSGHLNIELVNNQFNIPLKFLGKCRDVAEKKTVRRGVEILPQDFEKDKNFVTEDNMFKKRMKSVDESTLDKIPKWLSESDPRLQRSLDKKQEANDYLKGQRTDRVKGYKDEIIKKKFEQMSERLKSMGMPTLVEDKGDNSDNEVGAKVSAPRDFEFEVGMQNRRVPSPKLQIPEAKDSLYVVKHIGKYEPLKGEDDVTILKFEPNPDVFNKKKFSVEPKNHAEVRDVTEALTGEQLQQIYAGPTYIDFGSVYVKSSQKKYFTIRNDLRTAIQVQLFTDAEELSQSYLKSQIIPSGETAGFDIVVQSSNIKNIKQTIKYVINKKHSFEFQIQAKIELVRLDLQKTNIRMSFPEDNIDLFTSEVLRVQNNGNGPAKFKFQHTPNRIFQIVPEEGVVAAQGYLDLTITYSPQPAQGTVTLTGVNDKVTKDNVQGQSRPAEEEKIIMRVADGSETIIKCSGQVPEPKVTPKISIGNNLNLKEIAVCKQELREFQIRNNSRFSAIFQIDLAKLPECTEVTPMKGKLGPDEYRSITVKFYCKEEKTIEGDIRVLIRGGKTIAIPFYAKTLIPQILISEDQFDFGNITTLSNSSALKMTLTNNSPIPVEMVLDLRGEDENPQAPTGIDCLDINLDQENNDDDVLHSVHPENDEEQEAAVKTTKPQAEEDLGNDALNESDLSEEENLEQKKPKLYNFTMNPGQVLVFTVKFSPKETRYYKFLMPITLARYGYLNSMQKYIICKGLNPKFLIEPQICEFKRKIITTPDKCIATNQDIMLSNPDRKPMKWWIDVTQLNIDKIFQINPSEGIVQPGSTAIIKASFNPFSPQKFEKSVSLYVDDPEISSASPYMDIVLKGEGLFPRLLFDRKEIILPVVPLNVQASCMFRIVNDGYENLNLKYKIIQDISNISVDLNFLEGKNLGITKNRLKIQAVFKSNKPLSFTTRIEFYDDTGRIYTIPISGTSDNCLFTNFAFLQRCSSEFNLVVDQDKKGPVILVMDDADDDVNSVDGEEKDKAVKKKGAPSVISNKTLSSQASSKNSQNALGYSPIPSKDLEESCEFIKRWLNYNVLTQTVLNFPGSVIENNGVEILELITYLTGRQHLSYKVNMEGVSKRVDRCQKLFKQYDDMIKQLKTEGALLNHIRPEYLLGFNDYTAYIKLLPKNITDFMTLSSQKLTLQRFTYISIDAWITVFYQILKIYYLLRINAKNFRSIQGVPPEKTTLPSYIDGSNVYSQAECILLYWLEVQYELQHRLQQKRLINFDSEFQNGQIISSTVQSYVGLLRDLEDMKVNVVTEADLESNGEKLISALRRIGLQTHLKKEDIYNANQRQNLLFCLQLLHALPHYIPKSQPIIFACVLGEEVIKNIELTNSTPTGKPISYNVTIEGAAEFTLESEDCFSIEPKETYKVKVKFTSRVSDQVSGKITFTNKKESNVSAAALVFELQSNITGRVSIRQWPMQTTLYEKQFRDIMVHNPFTNVDMADFQVTLVCEKFKLFSDEKNQKQSKKKKKGVEKNEEVFPAFYCLKETFKIRKNQTQPLNIIFLPLVLEDQRCFVIFKDKNVGEFQHEIIGRVEEPQSVIDTFKFPQGNTVIYVDDPINVEFPINSQNEQANKARNDIISFMSEKHREKIKTLKNTQSSQFQQDKVIFPGSNLDQIVFDVELQPPSSFVTVPLTFSLTNSARQKPKKLGSQVMDDKKREGKPESVEKEQSYVQENLSNKFPMNLSFKNPFNGKLTLCLRNQQKTDIRKYCINIMAHPKPVKATLEFRVPAKNITTQDIPIINNTDKDWAIKVSLTGEHKKNFFMFYLDQRQSKEFTVRKKSTDYFHLHFAPKMQCVCEARLELFNPITNDKFDYELKGYGEEPVAEDHIVINCKARDSTQHDIEIKNPYNDKEVVYQVETDLINSSGPSTFTIKAGKTAKYPLRVSPVLSGQYTGSITFSESSDIYIWYTVLLNTESPRPTDCIELNSQIRQAVSFQIELQNPLKEIAMFDVIINGEGLIGESQFAVQSESTNVYELIFSPLFTGRQTGSIAFINENLGEIWYELKLISEDQLPVRLPVFKTELGKVDSHTVILENPTDKEVKVVTKIINQTNFDVIPDKIILKPYDSTTLQIRYMPSNLEMTENGEVTFITQELGKWKYLLFGIGVPPTKFNDRIVSAELNKDFSSTIHFKNPFKESINVTVTMEADEQNQEVFKLLTKSKKNETKTVLNVPGMNIAQIPFSFVPREINCYSCEIVVQMNEKIEWRYPIKGVTESIQNQTSYHFKTQCRNKLDQKIKILLPGLVQVNDNKDEFSYDLEIPQEFENLVKGCFRVKALKKTIDNRSEPVEFDIQFEPLKPFKTSFDFNVLRQAGGRWKFRMILEATAPKEDDLIVISSPLNRTTSVSFKLTNHRKKTAFFTASFTPESDPEFTIMPKQGDMERHGTEGTTFIISFTPIEYGKILKGKLIIQTDELYWQLYIFKPSRSYSVKGVLPKYNPPVAIESGIDDKHNEQISQIMNTKNAPKNYMIDNIKKTKIISPNAKGKIKVGDSLQLQYDSKIFSIDKSQSFISKK